ncbi:MAG: hypothetical protein IPK01_00825 [Acidobacteria bacterium]|nr:hypothetical protein [Acidobacteriota bacterium]
MAKVTDGMLLPKDRLQHLSALRDQLIPRPLQAVFTQIKSPPMGFTRILYADDKPQDGIVQMLQREFKYEVTTKRVASAAISAIENGEFDIVLCDLHFKRYNTGDEGEFEGLEVMKKAIARTRLENGIRKPVVVCTSITDPHSDLLPEGVYRCTGRNSQNINSIHSTIWAAARERHAVLPAMEDWQKRPDELIARDAAELCIMLIDGLTRQWKGLAQSIKDIALNRFEDQAFERLHTLTLPEQGADLTVGVAAAIRDQIETVMSELSLPHDAQIYHFLHSGVRQFNGAVETLNDVVRICHEIVGKLKSNSKNNIGTLVNRFSDSTVPLGFTTKKEANGLLVDLRNELSTLIRDIESPALLIQNLRSAATERTTVTVYVFEENDEWQQFIEATVGQVQKILDGRVKISIKFVPESGRGPLAARCQTLFDELKDRTIFSEVPQLPDSVIVGSYSLLRGCELANGVLVEEFTRIGVPVVCLTAGGTISERKEMRSLGVPENWFLTKLTRQDLLERDLVRVLNEILVQPPKVVLEMVYIADEESGLENGVEFRLNKIPFEVAGRLQDGLEKIFESCTPRGKDVRNPKKIDDREIAGPIVSRIKSRILETATDNQIRIDRNFL